MRRALFLPIFLLLCVSSLAHKAIEDEVEIPEEMLDQADPASKQKAEKAKQDSSFFEGLDSIAARENRDMMFYL